MNTRRESQAEKNLLSILFIVFLSLGILIGGGGCSHSDEPLAEDIHEEETNFLPLTQFRLANEGAKINIEKGQLQITSLPRQWSYSASAPLISEAVTRGPVVVVVKTRVLEGNMAFGVLNRDKTEFIIEKAMNAGPDYVDIDLPVSSIEEASDLVIRTWADDGKVSKAIVESVGIILDKSPRDFKDAATVLLHQLILKDYPELRDKNISDWKKVNTLRQWTCENIDIAVKRNFKLDENEQFNYYYQKAPAIFSAFLQDKGGVGCGGAGYALMQLYDSFGFRSYTYNSGYPDDLLTHVVTLVEINYKRNKIVTLQDALFDISYVDQNNEPYDFFDLLRVLKGHGHQQIKVLEGNSGPRDIIVGRLTAPDDPPDHWAFKFDKSPEFVKYLPQGWTKFKSKTTKEELYQWGSNSAKLWSFLDREEHPRDPIYLFLYPLGVGGNDSGTVLKQIKNILE